MPAAAPVAEDARAILGRLGLADVFAKDGTLAARSPLTGETIGILAELSVADTNAAIDRAHDAYLAWRKVPAPRRGELVRLLGE